MKHAFNNHENGTIDISFDRETDHRISFNYTDNGTWQQPSKLGFGEELLQLLTEQINGEFNREESTVNIKLPS